MLGSERPRLKVGSVKGGSHGFAQLWLCGAKKKSRAFIFSSVSFQLGKERGRAGLYRPLM